TTRPSAAGGASFAAKRRYEMPESPPMIMFCGLPVSVAADPRLLATASPTRCGRGSRPSRRAIDFATIALLLGMMIVVAYLRRAGFFARLTGLALGRVKSPKALLAATMLLSAVLSALLVNDVVCVALTPLVL